ncbi:DUF6289 family protein [Solwaraspora sp. WMMD792]|uniref:DUF6289 family protein n=1 Tax=Solwaraspora sp. WMMD792 TaxID=3016099 RepID=UPI002415973F|nr:DUF6289 family protein [Solwaraspora sp. WMMD792]MDG4769241.1 DUF6289 family protein [Solwaraspora sp. WMMD792]
MIRRTLFAAMLAIGAFVAVPASVAHAAACGVDYHCATYYYSDPNHTTQVGYRVWTCGGDMTQVGATSPYSRTSKSPC